MKTSNFEIVTQSPASFGYWCIERADGVTTGLFVGSEGDEILADLKRAYRKRRGIFDALCGEYFADGATVYRGDECGHLLRGTFVPDEPRELPTRGEPLGQEKYTNADPTYLRPDGKTINGGY